MQSCVIYMLFKGFRLLQNNVFIGWIWWYCTNLHDSCRLRSWHWNVRMLKISMIVYSMCAETTSTVYQKYWDTVFCVRSYRGESLNGNLHVLHQRNVFLGVKSQISCMHFTLIFNIFKMSPILQLECSFCVMS